ncbi:MAG: branched-chain amino acid ABC transporter permease, partial [Deltaproteobacteria bacterium]|nr:branched-chain amino acid ABC transporter permease [Deltaproteobacteria bacterium]
MALDDQTQWRSAVTAVVIVALFASLPLIKPPVYIVSFLFQVFIYVTIATAWNFIGGYAGYLSFGHVAFFGIGAYTSAMLANAFRLSPVGIVLSSLPAGLVALVVAVVVGYPCLRLRGPYFAVITLCFAFVVDLAVRNLAFLGGADGLWVKAMDLPIGVSRSIFYELMLMLTVVTVLASVRIGRSKFGAGLRAIKEDEEVAQTMAVNAPLVKIKAFALSAFFPGVAGGLDAYYLTYIHPDIVFEVNISILVVLMALFGGGGTWLGPVIGALVLSFVNELLSTFVKAELARIIYGCLFIVVII